MIKTSVIVKNWLRRLAGLIPYIIGAFLVTSLLQVSVYDSITNSSSEHQTQCQPESDLCNLPLWAQPTLLNITNFHWIMNNESTCKMDHSSSQNNATRIVLVLVHTARSYFKERLVIRKSYGSMPIYKNWTIRFAFLLGEPDPTKNSEKDIKQLKKERRMLLKEQKKYGDVVIGSFHDSYHNLTYKHMMGYKWALNFCPEAELVMKVDDDMFIDILRWLDWRTRDLKISAKNGSEKVPELLGFNFGGGGPIRDKGSKWYASEEDYPEEKYPSFCSGWGYGITIELMKRLYTATAKVKFFWIDDVFSTGILLKEVNKEEPKPVVKYLGNKISGETKDYRSMCEKKAFYKKRQFKCVTYIPRGDLFERDMMCMWNKTLHDSKYNFKGVI